MNELKPKAGEVVGELQRMLKTFEALGRAQKVIEVLADAEKRERDLNTSIEKLKQEEIALDTALDAVYGEVETAKAVVLDNRKRSQDIIDNATAKAKAIVSIAEQEANLLVDTAKKYVEDMEGAVRSAEDRKRKALQELSHEEDALNIFKAKAKAEKERIKSTFGL